VGSYLVGGGIQAGETPEQTVEREAKEECGLLLKSRSVLGRAVDIVHSTRENACFEKRSTFLAADLIGITSPEEHDHELIWVDRSEAISMLSHAGHRWAVGTFIE
jgi:8-oxo-dGTP pyrophosphatase MutT (NUDIX family)